VIKEIKEGARRFRERDFVREKELFEKLSKGQNPRIMFITCSDSRINPYLITNSKPGDLFVVRNAGNIIPPYGDAGGSEAAAVELAVVELQVEHIMVCGHSGCGAMTVLFDDEARKKMPLINKWLEGASDIRQHIHENFSDHSPAERITAVAKENALAQLENLKTHPCVAAALAAGKLVLTACYYNIRTGEIFAHVPETKRWELLD